ncbi:MAG: isocitrate lyase/phosphoenolpyruvate mutase family protein, partial [Chloroflexi bacterium]|nr:isocitrate lyase/phosphoenolpyruvate mutase family protein [Chloroflexota bacterium]
VGAMTANLKAALEGRKDPSLVIVGRTAAMAFAGVEAAVQRVKAYSEVGVDAIFLTGVTTRDEVETVSQATDLPLLLGSTPSSINDLDYLGANGVRIALAGHLPFMASVKAVYDTLKHLREGGSPEELKAVTATEDMMAVATDLERYSSWQREHLE